MCLNRLGHRQRCFFGIGEYGIEGFARLGRWYEPGTGRLFKVRTAWSCWLTHGVTLSRKF